MSESHRNFDEEFPPDEVESVTFQLGGRTFHSRTYLHPAVLLERDVKGLEGMYLLLKSLVISEDAQVLDEILHDPNSRISSKAIANASAWLIEHLSRAKDRPTMSPGSSGAGGEATEPSSEETSSDPVPVST